MNSNLTTIYIDEAGRWPLAWPVHVGLIVVQKKAKLSLYKDSKKCSPKLREVLFQNIKADPHLTFAVGISSAAYIDRWGISKAIQHAIIQWIHKLQKQLKMNAFRLVIDGNHDFGLRKKLNCDVETIIKWDDTVPAISAASIVAKVTRDTYMDKMHRRHPEYGFDKHKGYGTQLHYSTIHHYGLSPLHRQSFIHEDHQHARKTARTSLPKIKK